MLNFNEAALNQAAWDQDWLLRYADRRLEERYRDYWARQGVKSDIIYMAISVFIWALPVHRMYTRNLPSLGFGILVLTSNAANACLAVWAPALFLKHRTRLLLVHKVITSVCASAIRSVPTSKSVESVYALLTYLILYSKVLFSVANGWVALSLVFPIHAAEHLLSLIITLVNNPALCHDIESNLVGARERLQAFSAALSLPLAPFEAGKGAPMYSMNPARSCLWILSWMQITFGFGLSLALVYIADAHARSKYERLHRGAAAFNAARPPEAWVMHCLFLVSLCLWGFMQTLDAGIQFFFENGKGGN